jgi:hypothetical protein
MKTSKTFNYQLVTNICNSYLSVKLLVDWIQYVNDTPLHKYHIGINDRYDMFEYNEQCN